MHTRIRRGIVLLLPYNILVLLLPPLVNSFPNLRSQDDISYIRSQDDISYLRSQDDASDHSSQKYFSVQSKISQDVAQKEPELEQLYVIPLVYKKSSSNNMDNNINNNKNNKNSIVIETPVFFNQLEEDVKNRILKDWNGVEKRLLNVAQGEIKNEDRWGPYGSSNGPKILQKFVQPTRQLDDDPEKQNSYINNQNISSKILNSGDNSHDNYSSDKHYHNSDNYSSGNENYSSDDWYPVVEESQYKLNNGGEKETAQKQYSHEDLQLNKNERSLHPLYPEIYSSDPGGPQYELQYQYGNQELQYARENSELQYARENPELQYARENQELQYARENQELQYVRENQKLDFYGDRENFHSERSDLTGSADIDMTGSDRKKIKPGRMFLMAISKFINGIPGVIDRSGEVPGGTSNRRQVETILFEEEEEEEEEGAPDVKIQLKGGIEIDLIELAQEVIIQILNWLAFVTTDIFFQTFWP